MTLGEFLKLPLSHEWNCSSEPADWAMECGHPDFAEQWRGIVDPEACRVAAEGILLDLWCEGIGDSLPVAKTPYLEGDIAVAKVMGYEVGAIFTGKRWAIRADRMRHFIAEDAVDVLKAWRP